MEISASLHRVLVDADGSVSVPVEIAAAPSLITCSAVAFNGTDHLVVWAEPGDVSSDIYGVRLLSGANPESATPALLAGDDAHEFAPSLAASASGRFLLAYQRFVDDPDLGATRARARLVEFEGGALGAPCASDSECESAHCVDEVCCDAACGTSTTDCLACSRAAGAPIDGTCVLLGQETVCRAVAAECDAEERCTGSSVFCPADGVADDTTVCRPGSCVDGWVYEPTTCNGTHMTCPATPLPLPCGAFACGATTCLTRCFADWDCNTGRHCVVGGVCAADSRLGEPCVISEACRSGHCVDGVCCESACAGECEACDDTGRCVPSECDGQTDVDAGAATTDDGTDGGEPMIPVGAPSIDAGLDASPGDAALDGTLGEPSATTEAGCGCRAAGARHSGFAPWLALVVLLAVRLGGGRPRRAHSPSVRNA